MCAHACAHAHTCTIGYGKKERDCLHRDLIPYTVIRTRSHRNFWVWIGDDCGRVWKLIQEFYPGGPVFAVCCRCLTAFALSWSSGGGALQEICCDQHHARRKKEFMWCWSLGEMNCRRNFLYTLTQKTKFYKTRENWSILKQTPDCDRLLWNLQQSQNYSASQLKSFDSCLSLQTWDFSSGFSATKNWRFCWLELFFGSLWGAFQDNCLKLVKRIKLVTLRRYTHIQFCFMEFASYVATWSK